jgi:glyoxylase-like metal-dependent hydrolase (beta-lactamase superfamily II)
MSYYVDLGPDGRYVFSGDCIYDAGKVWDLYSLQKGWSTHDYHGFMGDLKRLTSSLRRIGGSGASALIPSHGPIIREPVEAVELTIQRLEAYHRRYAATSALRHYFPNLLAEHTDDETGMPWSMAVEKPEFLSHVGTTWILHSSGGALFFIDCGSEVVIKRVRRAQERGRWGAVEGLWISHYHDDHVDAIPDAVAEWGCPVIADEHVAQVVESPESWRLPCISPARVGVDRVTRHGDSWTWREYTMTAYHLPGQTLYHGGLLVEGRGMRLLFVGDSFVMSGLDDYCAGNRNWLGEGVGFAACLDLVEELAPDLMFNCHVDAGFAFSAEQIAFMRANLAERIEAMRELTPWDDPNYALDEHWIRPDPYEQSMAPGEIARIDVVITNHSVEERCVLCRPEPPPEWNATEAWSEAVVERKSEGRVTLRVDVPAIASPGRYVIPIDVTYDGRRLGPIREAILRVEEGE